MENETIIVNDGLVLEKPKKMLISKVLLVLTAVVLYVMQGFIVVPMWGILHQVNLGNINFKLVGILLVVSFITGLAAFIFAIVGAVKKEEPLTKITVIVKAAMIPFFIINLISWLELLSGMLNPFTLFGIPFVIAIGVCLTYVYMLMTGMPDVFYTIIFCVKNKKRPKLPMVVGIILCFFFTVDLVGSILIHKSFNKILEE